MITLFISSVCPDSPPALDAFKNSDPLYEVVDINKSISNLKRFLYFRDRNSFFDLIKEKNNVGVPSIMVGEGEEFYEFTPNMDLSFLKTK